MNIEAEVWYSLQDNLQEPCIVQVDDSVIQHIILRYLHENKGRDALLEDWTIQKVCLD